MKSGQDKPALRIRAHHLLCLQGFQGYGYDAAFVANMHRVLRQIRSGGDCVLQIVDHCDAICACCPHNKQQVCRRQVDSAAKTADLDHRVFKKLGLAPGQSLPADQAFSLVQDRLKSAGDVKELCGQCRWKDKCLLFASIGKRESDSAGPGEG